jgi:hypothetical protein
MDDRKQKYLDILTKKLDALLKIHKSTRSIVITGEGDDDVLEVEADEFATLYDNRAKLIAEIEIFDKDLLQYKDLEDDEGLKKKKTPLIEKIRETAKAIVELDKKNIAASTKLMAYLKGNIKQIRDGRDISSAYSDTSGSMSGYYFDRTN